MTTEARKLEDLSIVKMCLEAFEKNKDISFSELVCMYIDLRKAREVREQFLAFESPITFKE